MMLSLYSLLLRAVVQPLAGDMGVLRMPRHARMAVPLASLLLARTASAFPALVFCSTGCA
jgi:hypothetical protein